MKGLLHKGNYSADLKIKVVQKGLKYRGALAACEEFGVSRRCFDKWLGQAIDGTRIHMEKNYEKSDHPVIKLFLKKLLKPYIIRNKKLRAKNEYLKTQFKLVKPYITGRNYNSGERQTIIKNIERSRLSLMRALECLNISYCSFKLWPKVTPRSELKQIGEKKYKREENIKAVFNILHHPPKDYGINRTNWKLLDLQKQLKNQGTILSIYAIRKIIKNAGYSYRKASRVLVCKDPQYKEKLDKITSILKKLRTNESFFSIDEFGPFSVKRRGGKQLMAPGQKIIIPKIQRSKGLISFIGALNLSNNQITYLFGSVNNSDLTSKLVSALKKKYSNQKTIYLSWDSASHHVSKKVIREISKLNQKPMKPKIKLAPLPTSSQFLNVIESVYGAMYRAVLQNSNYCTRNDCIDAIARYFKERNKYFKDNPRRAGNKIWRGELTLPAFNTAHNCVEPTRW